LFTLTPSGGSGNVNFKADNDVTYRGIVYTGLPMTLSGEKRTAETGLNMPKLTIGQTDIDLSLFKPMIYDGYLDNAVIVKSTVLTNNLINNANIRELRTYRVKRVEQYSRTQIIMQLATLSDSLGFMMPYRQYLPPAFPTVKL
jgi:phage-related protein